MRQTDCSTSSLDAASHVSLRLALLADQAASNQPSSTASFCGSRLKGVVTDQWLLGAPHCCLKNVLYEWKKGRASSQESYYHQDPFGCAYPLPHSFPQMAPAPLSKK